MRLDQLLVYLKLSPSRTLAQELIKNGFVYLKAVNNDKQLLKSNFEVNEVDYDKIYILENSLQKYVSRGGLKLEAAAHHLQLNIKNKTALDIGQSTGGFSDFLLQNDVVKIIGIDVGKDQLHQQLKKKTNLISFESLHVKDLATHRQFLNQVPEGGFNLAVGDVSFISLEKVMPFVEPYLATGAEYLFLVKPQFELGPDALDKNGIVKDEKTYLIVQNRITLKAQQIFGQVLDYFKCDLIGKDGNQEFFIYGKKIN